MRARDRLRDAQIGLGPALPHALASAAPASLLAASPCAKILLGRGSIRGGVDPFRVSRDAFARRKNRRNGETKWPATIFRSPITKPATCGLSAIAIKAAEATAFRSWCIGATPMSGTFSRRASGPRCARPEEPRRSPNSSPLRRTPGRCICRPSTICSSSSTTRTCSRNLISPTRSNYYKGSVDQHATAEGSEAQLVRGSCRLRHLETR